MSAPAKVLPVVVIGTKGKIEQVNQLRADMEARIDEYNTVDSNRIAKVAADHLAAAAYWMNEYINSTGMGA